VAVLFSDIRNFSTTSEKMNPQELVSFLNEYLTEMTNAIRPHGGYLNNFIGDAIVAILARRSISRTRSGARSRRRSRCGSDWSTEPAACGARRSAD